MKIKSVVLILSYVTKIILVIMVPSFKPPFDQNLLNTEFSRLKTLLSPKKTVFLCNSFLC